MDQIHLAVTVVVHTLNGDWPEWRTRSLREWTVWPVDVTTNVRVEIHVRRIRRVREGESRALAAPGTVSHVPCVPRCTAVAIGGDVNAYIEALVGREGKYPLCREGNRIARRCAPAVRVQNYDAAWNNVRQRNVVSRAIGFTDTSHFLDAAAVGARQWLRCSRLRLEA